MPQTARPATPSLRRFGGLDGLRAIAVGLVLVYHLFPGALRGGFLGVDVFFAISGFLITSLLLRELQLTGGIRLGAFWRRRARRLLPALGLTLLVGTALGLLAGGDALVGVGGQLAGAALFVSNWVFVATGADYFARDTPELFRNTWSLSIEEQFYLALPLLLLLLIRFRRRAALVVPLMVLGLGSAVLMAGLSAAGQDPTRIYFGSDTHVFGLLLGAALACAVQREPRAAAEPEPVVEAEDPIPVIRIPASRAKTVGRQIGCLLTAAAGLSVLGYLSATLPEAGPESFRGGFQLATAASLATVWAVTRPGAWAGTALDAAPLRWIGERSYGIYLWHWPLLVIFTQALGPRSGAGLPLLAVGALTLVVTIAVAALSYRYVEQPIRRLGLRRSIALLFAPRKRSRRRLVVASALGAVLLVTVPATVVAVVNAPDRSSAADAIARGQEALDERDAEGGDAEKAEDQAEDQAEPGSEKGADEPAPEVVDVEGRDMFAIGDSVMLASLPELDEAFPGISVDAAVSRGLGAGVGIVEQQAGQDSLRSVIVIGLGTNGPVDAADLDAIRQFVGDRPIVLVNAHGERDWIPGVNALLADYAAAHRGVVLADWDGTIAPHPDLLAGDGIHPGPSGGALYAETVQQALDELEQPGEAIGYAAPRR
ncbi:acetyltransferase [Leucobacter sp. CSA1]|uniref:Acetyltransferase n=1 Tax=Leucobacter chromiisoli TaxID=2796471 RepID=A0A934QAI2_9MICO|nr:acyltransferase family protein [Leucobacter chromiisoli]MBK0419757.1 acetyltransferase [Leucobacter chromiisoli]